MVLNKDELASEIDKLKISNTIKNKIFVNKTNEVGLPPSDFIKYINNDNIKELDDQLNHGCIKDKSLYEISEKKIVNGLKVCVLNDINIYRTYLGFLNKEVQDEYVKNDLQKPIYFSNKYYCYALARTIWGGIHSFKIKKKITLIDMFDKDNVDKILYLADKYIPNEDEKIIFKKMLKITSSLTLKDSIMNYNEHQKIKKDINIYTLQDVNTFHYCKNNDTDLYYVPMTHINKINNKKVKYDYNVRYIFFKYILPHLKNINGMIYKQIPTIFLIGGRYFCEEILIDGNTFIHDLDFDTKDDICWVNYGLKQNYRNIHLYFNIGNYFNLLYQYNQLKNENFALFNYYKNNKLKVYTKIDKEKKYILSYNLHMFKNMSNDIQQTENILNVLRFIKHYKNNVDIIFFQEFKLDKQLLDEFMNFINEIGYTYSIFTSNGGSNLVCFTKLKYKYTIIDNTYQLTKTDDTLLEKIYKYTGKNIIDLNMTRNQIILHYNNINICGVHLSIGVPLLYFDNEYIDKINNNIRIKQLKQIITHKPDMIIGDFNFTKHNNEHEFISRYYYHLNKDNDNSTPYNRVDHVYYNKNIDLENKLLICNYSDHLPLIQELPLFL